MGVLRPLRPLVEGDSRISVATKALVPLMIGFTLAASAVYAAIVLGSEAVAPGSVQWAVAAALPVLCVLGAVIDWTFPRLRCPMVRRQTPKHLTQRFGGPVGGFLWGLDTGSVMTTFRTSSASWVAVALAAAGYLPAWAGVVYAGAFTTPLAAMVWTGPVREAPSLTVKRSVLRRWRDADIAVVGEWMMSNAPRARRAAAVVLIFGAAATLMAIVR